MALPLLALGAIQAAPGIAGLFIKNRKTPQERAAEDAANQANDLIHLSMNPDDPRFKNMVESESTGIRGGFLQNLRDMIEANRRQASMGRTQFFDPERRDEGMFSAVDKAGKEAQIQARSNVVDRINQAVGRLQGQQQGYTNLALLEGNRRNQRRQALLGGLSGLSQGVNSYFSPTKGAV